MDCSWATTERNSASHRNILKISGSQMSSAAPKMSCSGSRKSWASRDWSPKEEVQSTKAAEAAAPGSNTSSPSLRSSLSAATRYPRRAQIFRLPARWLSGHGGLLFAGRVGPGFRPRRISMRSLKTQDALLSLCKSAGENQRQMEP